MAEVRMAEAASLLGVSVATVWRRLRRGDLQGRRDPDGHWLVTIPDEEEGATATDDPVDVTESSNVEVTLLRADLEHSRALIAEVQQHRDDLLRQLDAASVERAELRGLLAQAVGKLIETPRRASSLASPGDVQPYRLRFLRGISLPPQAVALVAGAVLVVGLVISVVQAVSLAVVVLSVLTVLLIGYLALLPSDRHEESAKAREDVEQAQHQFRQRLSDAARDLDRPLNVILSYARLIRHRVEGEDDPTAQREVRSIEDAALRMQRVIADFQDAAGVDQGQVGAPPSNGNLIEVAR